LRSASIDKGVEAASSRIAESAQHVDTDQSWQAIGRFMLRQLPRDGTAIGPA
jgi:hypothetical protein